jgi:hypothetical protein
MASAWEGLGYEATEFRELDDERVLAIVRYLGQGKGSGLELAKMRSTGAAVFHISNGEVIRFIAYWNRDRALADLGLKPETG